MKSRIGISSLLILFSATALASIGERADPGDPGPDLPYRFLVSPLSEIAGRFNLAFDYPVSPSGWLGFKGTYYRNSLFVGSTPDGGWETYSGYDTYMHGFEFGPRYTYRILTMNPRARLKIDWEARAGVYASKELEGAWPSGESLLSGVRPAAELMTGLRFHSDRPWLNFEVLNGFGGQVYGGHFLKGSDVYGNAGGFLSELNFVVELPSRTRARPDPGTWRGTAGSDH